MSIDLLTQSAHYTLSVRLSTDGFSAVVYSPLNGGETRCLNHEVNTQRSMAANVKGFLSESEYMTHSFRQVNLVLHTHRFTLVPLEWFEDEQMETIFWQNFRKDNNEIVLCNVLGKSGVVVIFGIDKLTHSYLMDRFPDARIFASVSPQIEYLSHKSKLGNNRKLYANLHAQSMEVFCLDRGRLQLCNSYAVSCVDDYCYYLLCIWKQLAYDQQTDELHLVGGIGALAEVTGQLKRYVKKVFIINPKAEFAASPSDGGSDVPFDIQSLLICE